MTRTITLDMNDPELDKKLKSIHEEIYKVTREDLHKLGKILRKRSVFFFKRFLKKHKIKMPAEHIPLFMDYLITKRIDLKDMEPAARVRLREYMLKNQPKDLKTRDYLLYVESELAPSDPVTCKSCRWFIVAPPGEHDTCVELGTKGSDRPCYGYVKK